MIPILVINLDSAHERWQNIERIRSSFSLDNLIRIRAIEGSALDQNSINAIYDEKQNKKYYYAKLKKAEIACALSHRLAWMHLIAQKYDFGCIVEDDIKFTTNPQPILKAIIEALDPSQPQMIRLYSKHATKGKTIKSIEKYKLIQPTIAPLGMVGIIINKKAAEIFLNHTKKIYQPIDVAIQEEWKTHVRSLVLEPNIIMEDSQNLGGTTLHNQEHIHFLTKVKKEIIRPLYRLYQRTRAKIHNTFT